MLLLTGALGFIGSAYLRHLQRQGERVLLCDRFRSGEKWRNVRGLAIEELIFPEDLFTFLRKTPLPLTAVVHLGACSVTTEKDMDFLFENNFRFSKRLWEYATQKAIPFLYASSAATYGAGEQGFDDTTSPLALTALNKYGYSKQLFDCWVFKEAQRGPCPPFYAGMKFFNVFGPNEYHKGSMASMVWQAYRQIKQTGRVRLFKSYRPAVDHGAQQRDFVYVKQCCLMMEALRGGEVSQSGLYNVGSGKAHSFRYLVEQVFKALGRPVEIEYIEMPAELRGHYQYHTEATLKKWGGVAGRWPLFSFEASVKDYVKHYLEHSDSYLHSHQKNDR